MNYEIVRQAVHRALGNRNSNSEMEEAACEFGESNRLLEERLSSKMKEMEEIDLHISRHVTCESNLFRNLESQEKVLKSILIENGSLVDAETVDSQQTHCKEELKFHHNSVANLKGRKDVLAREILD